MVEENPSEPTFWSTRENEGRYSPFFFIKCNQTKLPFWFIAVKMLWGLQFFTSLFFLSFSCIGTVYTFVTVMVLAWSSYMLICCAAELMLLGFISLLLTATSRTISNICIDSKFYNSNFSPCTRDEVEDVVNTENSPPQHHKQLMGIVHHLSFKRTLTELSRKTCSEACVHPLRN